MPSTGGGNRGSLSQAPSVNSAGLVQITSVHQSHSSLVSSLYFRLKSACIFCFVFFTADANYLTWLLHSPLARSPHIVLLDLKPLIEDGNLQLYMYCVHAQKRASGAPRTHFSACKISTLLEGMPPDPLTQSILWGPTFCNCPGPPQSSWRP